MTESRLSRSEGRVREDITAGTEQPKPISKGTILLPERPIFLKDLSITKAIRAIYPVSSSIERKKNSTTMIGTKDATVPTPAYIPSIMRERTQSSTFQEIRVSSLIWVNQSMNSSSHSCIVPPKRSNVSQKMTAIIRKKEGKAVHLPVRILSMAAERMASLLFLGCTTVLAQRFSMKEYLISAIAAALSIPLSSSICFLICSIVSSSFFDNPKAFSIEASPSTNFAAAKRIGKCTISA